MSVNDTVNSENSVWNRQVYHRLKLAVSLGLRRQLFLAVSDDLHLRNQVAARLHSTLAYPVGQVLYQPADGQGISTPAYPRLVTLRLNVSEPNPIEQINQWLTNYPPPVVGASQDNPGKPLPIPTFQIVGVEQLTKESVSGQRLFLHYLRLCEQYFSGQKSSRFLESSVLLWLSRPWLSAIQQSVPEFWRWRTGVFVFAGEPTPATQNQGYPERFSSYQSFNFGNFEQSILDDFSLETEVRARDTTELELSDQIDLPTDMSGNTPQVKDEVSGSISELLTSKPKPQGLSTTNSQVKTPSLLSLSHVSQELTELVSATSNKNVVPAGEDNWQPQELLLEIEKLHSQKASGEMLATAYLQLGNLYRLYIEQGNSTLENLMVAIIAYQEAITYDDKSPELPNILNDLGTLYWMLYRTPSSSEAGQTYIEQAIEFYQLALKIISPETQTETYARVQNNLGTAYGDLAGFAHPAENWQKAVSAYIEALRYRRVELDALKYAACQNNLGTAYWHLAQYHQPIVHLKQAIAAYKQALAYYHPQDEPLKYGMIQNNIGTAYWNLAQYEQPVEHLQLAIEVYREALKYRTPANVPSACAATENNLGTAYWHLANCSQTQKEERRKLLQLCIDAYEEAIALADSLSNTALSFDLFATHNNLGLAHYQLVTDNSFDGEQTRRSHHLEAALNNHLQALNGLSKQPEAYQTTFTYIVRTIRAFHNELGIQGQNLALSKVPGHLLPEILPKL
ncbi:MULTISPECIES: tetratricopeptide repeat protein [unclassified Anabaena]|uniref:tetratricopeptide repeat protein n=1 Tax=unclassified Anabaena TaxID=2619674 RepID=UPI0008296CE2|nr:MULTISPECIES: tetratricopeptide repeat protein [unclassified Anabaena]